MKTVVFIGGYGHEDIGDESMLTADLAHLKAWLLNDTQFIALSEDPDNTRKYHNIESDYSINRYLFQTKSPFTFIMVKFIDFIRLPFRAINLMFKICRLRQRIVLRFTLIWRIYLILKGLSLIYNASRLRKEKKTLFLHKEGVRFLNILRKSDLLFNVGGGNLNSIYLLYGLYGKCFTYKICKIFGKPIILSGQTIGPIDRWIDKKFAAYFLNKVDVITLRDINASKELLRTIGVTNPIIKETGDDALLLPVPSSQQIMDILAKEKIEIHKPMIAINFQRWQEKNLSNIEKIIAEISDYLISEKNAQVIFIPMQYIGSYDDRVVASRIKSMTIHKNKVHILNNKYDDKSLKGIIGQVDFAIGSRYHFNVFATTSQVPTIGIMLDKYYSQKLRGILQMMGQEKYCCNIENLTFEKLKSLVDEVLLNKEKIREQLKNRLESLKEINLFAVRYAVDLLN